MKTPEKSMKKPGRPAGKSRSEIQLVGYLSRASLLKQLNALVKKGSIGHFWAVEHAPDEDTKKPHFHLRMTPPISRAVDWSSIVSGIVEEVPGEPLPRRLVASARAVNDQRLDGLLYARHDSRFLAAKGLSKAVLDYPREEFLTDDGEWLDQLWSESDSAPVEPRKLTRSEMVDLLERSPDMTERQLLRTCLVQGYGYGDFQMFGRFLHMLKCDQPRPLSLADVPALVDAANGDDSYLPTKTNKEN